jgi:hypothetical protein
LDHDERRRVPALRKLLPLTVVTIAVTAAWIAPASATPLEVQHESTGAHCGFTPNTDCDVQAEGEGSLEIFGIAIFTCQTELAIELAEDGTGSMHATMQDHPTDGDCVRQPCNGVGEALDEAETEIVEAEETATNASAIEIRFCIDDRGHPRETGYHCSAPMTVTESTLHDYRLDLNHVCPNLTHFIGDYPFEGSPIEIEHAGA